METNGLILVLLVATIGLVAAARSDLADHQRYSSSKHDDAPNPNVLFSDIGGGELLSGQSLIYRDYRLDMQHDCNLVVYNKKRPIWATGTHGRGKNCYLDLQSDGELVLHGLVQTFLTTRWAVIWRTNKKGKEGVYALVLNYDGSARVYGPTLWSSSSSGGGSTATMPAAASITMAGTAKLAAAHPGTIDATFWKGDNAPIGTIIENSDYKLVLQDNCNLTLSTTDSSGKVLWYTDSNDSLFDCYVNLEANGELRVKYLGGVPLWGNGVTGPPNSDYVLTIRPEGKLVIYGPSLWYGRKYDGVAAAVAESYGEKRIAMVTEE